MKCAFALACAAALVAPAPAVHGPVFSGMPPPRMQRDTAAIVLFVTDVEQYCGQPAKGYVIHVCVRETDKGVRVMVLPNGCPWGPYEYVARLACHESAHYAHGWSRDHEVE